MTHFSPLSERAISGIAGVAAILFYLWLLTWGGPAAAAPGMVAAYPQASQAIPAQIYRRGRTPIYPYWAKPGRPGGWSTYFGFVPYSKGDIENQAIKRQFYPQDTWPHSQTALPPTPWGF